MPDISYGFPNLLFGLNYPDCLTSDFFVIIHKKIDFLFAGFKDYKIEDFAEIYFEMDSDINFDD